MEEEVHPFGSLACAIVENPHAVEARIYPELHPRDSDFIRGKTPMTKESVRRLSLETLRIGADAVCFDIGAGTGSVSVEMGLAIRRQCGEGVSGKAGDIRMSGSKELCRIRSQKHSF